MVGLLPIADGRYGACTLGTIWNLVSEYRFRWAREKSKSSESRDSRQRQRQSLIEEAEEDMRSL